MNTQNVAAVATLTTGGIMVILFALAPSVFSLRSVVGVPAIADGILFLFATITGKVAEDQRRLYSLWGSVLAVVGVGLILTLYYDPLVTTLVLAGILLILIGGLVWWSGRKQS